MAALAKQEDPEVSEAQIADLLQYHYGDGMVYLPKYRFHSLYAIAKRDGFIDGEGYLTRKGRTLLARYQ